MRKCVFLLAAILLTGLSAAAQEEPSTEVVVGYSFIHATPNTSSASSFNLNGGTASGAWYPLHWLGVAGDFGGYHVGSIGSLNVDSNLFTYLFGPRVRLPGTDHIKPFGQVLLGVAHASSGTSFAAAGTHNAFAMAVGGGVDIPLTHRVGVRLIELDYLPTWFPETVGGGRVTQQNLRVSTGVRFHF